jgi:hypothetical protein
MSIPRGYVANHKFWDRMGRITPNVEWSESHRPHFEAMPAPWLNVQRYEYEIEAWHVVSSGKVVALSREGHLVPAGLRKAWCIATGSDALVYTTDDVTQDVIDLTTGVAVTAHVHYTEDELTAALRKRGLITQDERAMDFISQPIGIASYNYYQASGPDTYNPATLYQHNFRPQALCAVTCDYVATYPVLPAVVSAETMANAIANGASDMLHFFDNTHTRAAGWFGSTAIHGVLRYADLVAAGDDVVAYMCVNAPLAWITEDSPMTSSLGGLTNQVSSISAISAAGDFYVDYDYGVLFLYEADGNAIPSPWTTSGTIIYYHYNAEGSATNTLSTFACATGNLNYGDFLTYDDHSNLIKAEMNIATAGFAMTGVSGTPYSTDPDYDSASITDADYSLQIELAVQNYHQGIIGQVIGTTIYPKDYLDRVKTAYAGQTAANMQTPGSATGGRSDQLTYANAAERMVIVNLIGR